MRVHNYTDLPKLPGAKSSISLRTTRTSKRKVGDFRRLGRRRRGWRFITEASSEPKTNVRRTIDYLSSGRGSQKDAAVLYSAVGERTALDLKAQ